MIPLITMLGGAVVIVFLLQAIDVLYIRHRVKTRPVPHLLPAREKPVWSMESPILLEREATSRKEEIARLKKELKLYEEFFVTRADDN